jgi:hypothetical protein
VSRSSKKKRLASKRRKFAKGFEPCVNCQKQIHRHDIETLILGGREDVCVGCFMWLRMSIGLINGIKWLVFSSTRSPVDETNDNGVLNAAD